MEPSDTAENEDPQWWPLERLLGEVHPGSQGDEWTWEEELRALRETDNFAQVSHDLSLNAQREPVLVGYDRRLWDGHHRVCAAMYLGIPHVLVQVVPDRSAGR